MTNVFAGLLRRECNIINRFSNPKSSFNLNAIKQYQKSFFVTSGCYHNGRYDRFSDRKRQLPNLLYIQNPITWMINKIDFLMLRRAWDSDFDVEEFKRGVRQAVSVICTLISNDLWSDLRGLVTNRTLTRLERDVKLNWKEDLKKNLALEPTDIKLVLPGKVHFLRIADQKFVDVDVICVAMKFKEQLYPWDNNADIIIIEILARFHRNYTTGQLPNWTVTHFKVTNQNVKSEQ